MKTYMTPTLAKNLFVNLETDKKALYLIHNPSIFKNFRDNYKTTFINICLNIYV